MIRRGLLVVWLLAVAVPASAQVTFVQMKVSTAANAFETDGIETLTFDSPASAGTIVLVGVSLTASNRTITSITDDGGNSYAVCSQGGTDANREDAGQSEVWIYCGVLASPASAVTTTISSALATPGRMFSINFSGQNVTPVEDVAIALSSATTSHPVGPVVTAAAGAMLVGIGYGTSGPYTNNAGWTQIDSTTFGISAYEDVGAASTSYTVTSAGNESLAMALVALAPSGGGGGGGCRGGLLLMKAGPCDE